MRKNLIPLSGLGLMAMTASGAEPVKPAETNTVVTHVLRPTKRDVTEERLKQLKLPPGFQVNVFARDLGNPRMLVVADDGTVFVSRFAQGEVTALRDKDGDGVAEESKVVLSDIKDVHGLVLHDKYLYLASTKKLMRAPMENGVPGKVETLIKDFPDGGQHGKRTIGFGPDGAIYFSVGSSCNNCEETDPEHATILRIDPENWHRRIFAKGLRNTIGFAWHPVTKEMWGMDHGSDDRGDDIPPEELNRIKDNGDYGWPFCYGQNVVDAKANNPKEGTKEEKCAKAIPPVLQYQAHSAPIGFTFYTANQFPKDYKNDAFVVFRGSWNRKPATGYKIARVRFEKNQPKRFEDFVTGFLVEDGQAQFGRLAGITVAKDGALLFSDDANGMIYRVSYKK